jgi:pyruvate formate lyase activating enzyme
MRPGVESQGNIFSIERYAVHDGAGIRTMVYLKGCPLRCLWCANPEGQETRSELLFFAERCIACGRCLATCPSGAARRDAEGRITHDPALCRGCGGCVEGCDADARRLYGRPMTVAEVMAEVLRDLAFYRQSGGGVTLSGGEPTAQADFVRELLRECRRRGLHTAMETCGHCGWPELAGIAEHLDLALYDVKHVDPAAHQRLTGVPNDLILGNLRRLAQLGTVEIQVRVPVIPGYNDQPEHLGALAELIAGIPGVAGVEMLAYHPYGIGKYARCGRASALGVLEGPSQDRLEALAGIVRARGVACRVG